MMILSEVTLTGVWLDNIIVGLVCVGVLLVGMRYVMGQAMSHVNTTKVATEVVRRILEKEKIDKDIEDLRAARHSSEEKST
jgi:hypothetical protein